MFLPRIVESSRLVVAGSDCRAETEPAIDESLAALQSLFGPQLPLTAADRSTIGVLTRDLAIALAELAGGERGRAVLFAAAATAVWEIVLERDGADVLFSLFRPGPLPELALTSQPVSLSVAGAAAMRALDAAEEAVEAAISTPASVSVASASNVDVNADGIADVAVTITPTLVQAFVVRNSALVLTNAAQVGCALGQAQAFGVVGAATGNSLCALTLYDLRVVATQAATNTSVQLHQGVAIQVPADAVCALVPC